MFPNLISNDYWALNPTHASIHHREYYIRQSLFHAVTLHT